MSDGWEAGVSAPQDGRVIIAAWRTLRNGERAWRFRFVLWDTLEERWTVCNAPIGQARKPGHYLSRYGLWPVSDGRPPDVVPPPEVWRHIWEMPDE